jgi:hypothetical protein
VRWLLIVALVASSLMSSSSFAQVVGRLSYIEPDVRPEIIARGDPRRLPTGFVEVVHDRNLEVCRGRDYQNCPQFEWSVPFMPEATAKALERGLSEAWNRFNARAFWRIQTELGGQAAKLINCTIGQTNLDLFFGAWDHELIRNVPADDFCDGLNPDFLLYIPTFCSLMDAFTFWDRVGEAYRRGLEHAMTTYYPQYWQQVLELIVKTIPLALWWDGVYPVLPGQTSGLVLQPIVSTPHPGQYVNLALEAQQRDLRGFAYILARYPFLNLLGGDIFSRLGETVRKLPTETDRDGEPGLSQLEELKRTLSKREGIFSRPLQWADIVGQGPEPQGSSGAATPYEYAGVGHAVMLGLQSSFAVEVSPRVPIFWRVCFTESIPPLPVPVPVPMPLVLMGARVDTVWQSVPEGYPIQGIVRTPRF